MQQLGKLVQPYQAALTFNNGVISGTPTVNMTQTTYTIWANNTGGSVSTSTLTITVNEPAITFTYPSSSLTVTRGVDTVDLIPALGGGNVATMEISPALPNGLTLFSNGTIYGIPTVNMTQTTSQFGLIIPVAQQSLISTSPSLSRKTVFSYNSTIFVLTRDSVMTTLSPNLSGGNAATWEISQPLPSGLTFVNGVIWYANRQHDSNQLHNLGQQYWWFIFSYNSNYCQ